MCFFFLVLDCAIDCEITKGRFRLQKESVGKTKHYRKRLGNNAPGDMLSRCFWRRKQYLLYSSTSFYCIPIV